MKELHFSYDYSLTFDSVIREHHFTIKCEPHDDDRQKVIEINTSISPNDFISDAVDSFGNKCIYGYMPTEHEIFMIHVDGVVMCGIKDRIVSEDMNMSTVYKYNTPITFPGEELRALHDEIQRDYGGQSIFEKCRYVMNEVYNRMEYVPGSTAINSTAEEAYAMKKGVCQDYAHIFLSILRQDKIPCRYVVGFVKGEGESHAWCEVYDGREIFAFDPTNNVIVNDEHIKVSVGRDYSDCLINTGYFIGQAKQYKQISVIVS